MAYQPLNYWENEIRLIRISELDNTVNSAQNLIRCEMVRVSLISPPPYVALSYCWGDPEITRKIFLNGNSLQVTNNLYAALQQLKERGVETVWVDAICIDQMNVEERNLQLLRISAIYRKAQYTIAWIGEPTNESENKNAISLIRILSVPLHTLKQDVSDLGQEVARHSYVLDPTASRHIAEIGWKHLSPLFNLKYWRRVWIIQELALSQEVVFLYGRYEISWRSLDRVLLLMSSTNFLLNEMDPRFQHVQALRRFRTDALNDKPVQFLDAVFRSRNALATDIRDKIFGILGLTYDGSIFVPVPNYGRAILEIAIGMTMSVITYYRPLDIIAFFFETPITLLSHHGSQIGSSVGITYT